MPSQQNTEWKKKVGDKYLDLSREPRKLWSMRVTMMQIVTGTLWTVPERLEKGTGWAGNRKTNLNYPEYNIPAWNQDTCRETRKDLK